MALLSDIDWMILLAVGAFLLLGKENGAVLRQFGRYYGRLVRVKQELLADFAKAADLPPPAAGRAPTLRAALVQMVESPGKRTVGVPIAVTRPPIPSFASGSVIADHGAGLGPGTWSMAVPAVTQENWNS